MPRPRIDVTLLSSGHDVADARLHRHCAALRRAGLRVEVIAKGRAEDAPAETEFRSIRPRGIAGRGFPVRAVQLLLAHRVDRRFVDKGFEDLRAWHVLVALFVHVAVVRQPEDFREPGHDDQEE